ncbi:MAG: hypothetical protein FRX48_03343 [Lasallia pustulata]|uniref:Uncharacterized protein n=1 Tax=Lasallia pustulata TaxID=136370 RepID=A0A5M8PXE4_9LECA|nr:MAG: hypothetical protein FRX48_03343 [Lasallia pustulata]
MYTRLSDSPPAAVAVTKASQQLRMTDYNATNRPSHLPPPKPPRSSHPTRYRHTLPVLPPPRPFKRPSKTPPQMRHRLKPIHLLHPHEPHLRMFPIQHHAPLRPSIPIRFLLRLPPFLRIHPKQKRIDCPIDPDLGVEDVIRLPGPEQRHRRGGERGFLCDFAQGGCEGGAVGGFDGAGAGGPEVLVDADVGAAFEDADAEGGVRGGAGAEEGGDDGAVEGGGGARGTWAEEGLGWVGRWLEEGAWTTLRRDV